MPADVDESLRSQGALKSVGPHAPATVRRRLANWSTLTKWRGLDGAFASPALKSAIRLAVRAVPRTRGRRGAKAVTGDVLAKLMATCATDTLRDLRERAILMVAFASGGRNRVIIERSNDAEFNLCSRADRYSYARVPEPPCQVRSFVDPVAVIHAIHTEKIVCLFNVFRRSLEPCVSGQLESDRMRLLEEPDEGSGRIADLRRVDPKRHDPLLVGFQGRQQCQSFLLVPLAHEIYDDCG
ncbi:hypothetical protein C8J32_11059 [Rhizobium sp. PP-CC-3A-592]|nr:hypothetical protein C8J32_11059 [Rhizobium sp. PP-CC-3A-592]